MKVVYDKEDDVMLCPYCSEMLYFQHNGVLFCADCKKHFSSLNYEELDKDKKSVYERQNKGGIE